MSIAIRMIAAFRRNVATFILENHYVTTGAPQVVSFAGARIGDTAIIFQEATTNAPSGWSVVTTFNWVATSTQVLSKVLSAGDISTGSVTLASTAAGGLASILVYRFVSAVASVSTAAATATSLSIPGFSKAAGSKGVIAYLALNRNFSGMTFTKPTGTTQRFAFGGTNLAAVAADILPADSYTNGTALVWTALQSAPHGGIILELT